ncbi:unnamed protein product [Phytophthora fragariaefolia]|uniref:Unnamed protein product n=1 Tax=Phytophthora fragariaefolia TaxID=1490495 RepID=A0A9W6YB31_9STRA|nr:unnamed protein product [Phytophthora fragariaefolia]
MTFVDEVVKVVIDRCTFDLITGLTVTRVVFNMDQTSVYWDMVKRTTVEFDAATTVSSITTDVGGHRCTMALTVAADGPTT